MMDSLKWKGGSVLLKSNFAPCDPWFESRERIRIQRICGLNFRKPVVKRCLMKGPVWTKRSRQRRISRAVLPATMTGICLGALVLLTFGRSHAISLTQAQHLSTLSLSGSFDESAVFQTDLVIGGQRVAAIIDTGSSSLTLPCYSGQHAGDSLTGYNISATRNGRALRCGAALDKACAGSGLCSMCLNDDTLDAFSEEGTCAWRHSYSEGSTAEGIAIFDDVQISQPDAALNLGQVAFGCQMRSTGPLSEQGGVGVLGLSQGKSSAEGLLPRLVSSGAVDRNAFALRLTEEGGTLALGSAAILSAGQIEGPARLHVNDQTGWYELDLLGVAVSGSMLPEGGHKGGWTRARPASLLRRASAGAAHPFIVDSGSSFSYLPDDMVRHIVRFMSAVIESSEASASEAVAFRVAPPSEAPTEQTLCVRPQGRHEESDVETLRGGLPGIVMRLRGPSVEGGVPSSVALRLGPSQLWHAMHWFAGTSQSDRGKPSRTLCLGLFPASLAGGRSILGASALLERTFAFDVQGSTLSWGAPAGDSEDDSTAATAPRGRLLLEDGGGAASERRGAIPAIIAGVLTGASLAATVLCARLACLRYSAQAAARRYASLEASGLTPEEIDGLTYAEQQASARGGGMGLAPAAGTDGWARRVLAAAGLSRSGSRRSARALGRVDAAFSVPRRVVRSGRGSSSLARGRPRNKPALASGRSRLSSIDEEEEDDDDDLEDDELGGEFGVDGYTDDEGTAEGLDAEELDLGEADVAALQAVAREAAANSQQQRGGATGSGSSSGGSEESLR